MELESYHIHLPDVAGKSGKKKMILYHLDYINKLKQYYYLTAQQLPYQRNEKPFYATLGLWLDASVW